MTVKAAFDSATTNYKQMTRHSIHQLFNLAQTTLQEQTSLGNELRSALDDREYGSLQSILQKVAKENEFDADDNVVSSVVEKLIDQKHKKRSVKQIQGASKLDREHVNKVIQEVMLDEEFAANENDT